MTETPRPRPTSGTAKPRPSVATGARPSKVDSAVALRDVMQHVVKTEKETAKAGRRPTDGKGKAVFAVLLCVPALAFCAWSWFARPEFIWGPNENSVAPVRRDANMRYTMFLLAQRIRAYRRTEGALPGALSDVGEKPIGITYTIVGDSVFELRAAEEGKPVVLRSDEPTAAFLGNAQRVIQTKAP